MRVKNKICIFLLVLSYALAHRYSEEHKNNAAVAGTVSDAKTNMLSKVDFFSSNQTGEIQRKFIIQQPSVFERELVQYENLTADKLQPDVYRALNSGNHELPQFELFSTAGSVLPKPMIPPMKF